MDLTVIGAGPAYSDRPDSTGASYLIGSGERHVLLDLGQGSFPRLAGAIDPGTLDAILVSHLHPDHFIDLVPLRHYLRWFPPPGRRVRVVAPGGLADRLDALHAEPGFTATTLDVEAVEPGTLDVPGFRVDVVPVLHTDSSVAYRVGPAQGGPGLVYSGDCGRAEDLDALILAGDTLLVEVSFGPGPVPPDARHLDGPAVAGLAARTGVGRVLLTHIQMGFDRASTLAIVRAGFDGPVTFVDPGFSTTV